MKLSLVLPVVLWACVRDAQSSLFSGILEKEASVDPESILENVENLDSNVCSHATDCSACISLFTLGCGWCIDTENENGGVCMKGNEDGPIDGECPNPGWTFQDPHLYGDKCCYQYSDSCSSCLEDKPYCQYCSNFKGSGTGFCYHAQSHEEVVRECSVPIDKTACCSEQESCDDCLKPTVCSFCYTTKECRYSGPDSTIGEGWCNGGEDIVTHCCEGDNCEACFAHTDATTHDWTASHPPCVWQVDLNESQEDKDYQNHGNCVPYFTGEEQEGDDTKQDVLLGTDYCADECYMGNTNCKACVGAKYTKEDGSKGSCVWVKDPSYPDISDDNLAPVAKTFCTAGDILGPTDSTLRFSQWISMKTMDYEPGAYYWGVCTMSGTALLTTIIIACIVALAIIIAVAVVLTQMRNRKIRRIVSQAAKQADRELGDAEGLDDIRNPDALFNLWNDEVSWSDGFDPVESSELH